MLTTEDGNSVLLESNKFRRWYLAVGIGGEVVDPKTLVPGSREAHFGVRAEVGHYKYIETRMYSLHTLPVLVWCITAFL